MKILNKKVSVCVWSLLCFSFMVKTVPRLVAEEKMLHDIRRKYARQHISRAQKPKYPRRASVLVQAKPLKLTQSEKKQTYVFLVAFDNAKGMWNILLGRENDKGKDVWKEIFFYGLESEIPSIVQKETGGEILISKQDVLAAISEAWNNNERVYFISVPYKSAHTLNKALAITKTAKKEQLAWYPVDNIVNLHQGIDIKLTYGGGKYDAPLCQKTTNIIKNVWNTVKNRLSKGQQRTVKTVSQKRDLVFLQNYLQQYVKNVFSAINQKPYLAPAGGWNVLKGSGRAVFFYHADKPYYEFANFYQPAPILVGGIQYKTSEHYFQAQKFMGNSQVQNYIAQAPTPRQAYLRAKEKGGGNLQVSDEFRVMIMFQALILKFLQNPALLEVLLGVKEEYIVEDTGSANVGPHQHDDPFWGNGLSGKGENYLGRLLMYLRDLIRFADQS